MTAGLLTLASDAHDPAGLATFWAHLLGRVLNDDGHGPLLPGSDTQVGLRFVQSRAEKVGPNSTHLHLTSTSLTSQQETVATALRLGADHLDVGQRPEEGHVVLADPEGNEFCVIEPGNAFLSGCGFLAELACDGTREAGLFWAAALGWPLVWDENPETAIQSPRGGTKVAWVGPPVAPKRGISRQRFEVRVPTGDLADEVDRFMQLGATRYRGIPSGVPGRLEFTDPDGNDFSLIPA
ncbi:VOC family protein [uncultured Jatrophihabitans sp.]|uniref:VOC family protein n=1 Tax=uncultured Jatrophihabitans sp. TaxID=1610747 RepID=UPI0035C9E4E9